MLGWMYLTPAAQNTFLVTGSLTAAVLCWWVTSYGSPRLPTGYVAVSDKYLELERDRVLTAAKGIASTAVGFLTVLVTAFFESKPGIGSVPDVFLYSYVLGAAGCIALAAAMNADTRDFVADIH